MFGWRTARLIKQQSDRANLISDQRAEEKQRGAQGGDAQDKISNHLSGTSCEHTPVQQPESRGAVLSKIDCCGLFHKANPILSVTLFILSS